MHSADPPLVGVDLRERPGEHRVEALALGCPGIADRAARQCHEEGDLQRDVDDDADDREFLTDAIKDVSPEVDVVLAENGLVALDYLKAIKKEETKLPCLIVLDINMPYLDGVQTFHQLKQDATLKKLPVIVFSSSQKPDDEIFFNSLGIEYITKPMDIHYMCTIASHMVSVCCH